MAMPLFGALLCAASSFAGPVQAPGGLSGTLAGPGTAASSPVLILPGAGPVDRDGNGPGVSAAPYRLLAEGLAGQGVTTLRIDKRGLFGSRPAGKPRAVTMPRYAADARGWAATLRARTGARCVWLLGQGEGGLVALLAAQNPAGLCGLVLVGTPGRPVADIIRARLHASPETVTLMPVADGILSRLEAGRPVPRRDIPPPLMPLFRPAMQGFLRSELALRPQTLASQVQLPILIVQGEQDLQSSVPDAEMLAGAAPHARLALFQGMSHVLKDIPIGTRADNIATYTDPNLPLTPGLVDRIVEFLTHHAR